MRISCQHLIFIVLTLGVAFASGCGKTLDTSATTIPLPEHPRPDFMRADWENLNGSWSFSLDSLDVGLADGWTLGETVFADTITVPFSWAAPLSGIGRKDVHIGWYSRTIDIPRDWEKNRTWLVIGASDCITSVWCNGVEIGTHTGGYTPFAFDLTGSLSARTGNRLVIRVEDRPTKGRLVGKQVYGEAKGIWQTVYLEKRPETFIKSAQFTPDIDGGRATAMVILSKPAQQGMFVGLSFVDTAVEDIRKPITPGETTVIIDIPIPEPHLWDLEDPYCYDVDVSLSEGADTTDTVTTYFGMRKIGYASIPATDGLYVALNDRPVYLNMALDQSYHPEGFYTFPSDEFMREEIERAKKIGLNGLRIHIKTELPRKLYWADRLGLLIQADVPNIGGEPDNYGRANWEYTAFHQVERDYNHPAIFSWVMFNETWGLFTRTGGESGSARNVYLPETQDWVKAMYTRLKTIDPTRLVEDNSPCNYDHVLTDINSWHAYLPYYRWEKFLDNVVEQTHYGSMWNYIDGNTQDFVPMMNSECGSVWGYRGGTGDIDLGWEYHFMMNEFRRRPRIAGFIFTEFHDVINEWNGYYRFDRTIKDFGLDDLCPGMTVADFHADCQIIPGKAFDTVVRPGGIFEVPLTASWLATGLPDSMRVETLLHGWNRFGKHVMYSTGVFDLPAEDYMVTEIPPIEVKAPDEECLAVFCTLLKDASGEIIHRNFMPVRVLAGRSKRTEHLGNGTIAVRCAPGEYTGASWSVMTKSIRDGRKVWGTGTGYFEYEFPWPTGVDHADVAGVTLFAELASRRIQGKDMSSEFVRMGISEVSRAGIDPGHNPNSYPMTDTTRHPSTVAVILDGVAAGSVTLENDSADHRGLLSWLNQPEDNTLSEAGSYGRLVELEIGGEALEVARRTGKLTVRLSVESAGEASGGLSVYGEEFGRYPLDPTLLLHLR